jgi:hypothetical protein
MQISWNGFGSFTLSFKPQLSEVTVVTNPFTAQVGKMKPQVATLSVHSHEGRDAKNASILEAEHPEERKDIFAVDAAGEYEVAGVFVHGVHAPKKDGTAHTIFAIVGEGMRVGFLGALDRPLTDREIEALGPVDVLLVPAGGGGVLSTAQAAELVTRIEPRMVIPSHVQSADAEEAAAGAQLATTLGLTPEVLPKLKITKSGLPQEEIKIVLLEK